MRKAGNKRHPKADPDKTTTVGQPGQGLARAGAQSPPGGTDTRLVRKGTQGMLYSGQEVRPGGVLSGSPAPSRRLLVTAREQHHCAPRPAGDRPHRSQAVDRRLADEMGRRQPAEPPATTVSQPTSKPARQNTIKTARPKDSKPVRQKASKPAVQEASKPAEQDKAKATFYVSQETLDLLEEGRLRLRRLAKPEDRSQVSKSAIVETALAMALEELEASGAESRLARRMVSQ